MNSWSTQRKIIYLSIVLSVLFVFLVVPLVLVLKQNPTCFDGKKNGDEADVDCGGSCQLLCSTDRLLPIVQWSRIFSVSTGVYSAVAYVQNPNLNTEALAKYRFKLYDSTGALVATRENTTFIPKNRAIAVFEPNIVTPEGVLPARVTFEFVGDLLWRKNSAVSGSNGTTGSVGVTGSEISVSQNILSNESVAPRVDVTIMNKTTNDLENIEVVAVVYNNLGNAIGSSRTFVDRLDHGQSKNVVFTWPTPFVTGVEASASVVEIIPRIIPKSW